VKLNCRPKFANGLELSFLLNYRTMASGTLKCALNLPLHPSTCHLRSSFSGLLMCGGKDGRSASDALNGRLKGAVSCLSVAPSSES